MTTVEAEIFDDGQEPVTCARDFSDGRCCPQLMVTRFGTVYQCRLFSDTLGYNRGAHEGELQFTDGKEYGFIMPHPECLRRRKKS